MNNGLGDTQKGERCVLRCLVYIFVLRSSRWANIDYLLASAVKGKGVRMIKDSYDVACEHEKFFFIRAENLPEHIRLDLPADAWVFVVPKFHIGAHKAECQGTYSPNYTLHIARWDGEGVERLWWRLHAAAPSTKEMGRGSRWETLDDFCGFSNWRKTVQFGRCLLYSPELLS